MAQTKLQPRHSRRALIAKAGALAAGLSVSLVACAQATGTGQQRPTGLTLLFLNVGQDSIGVTRFDPDGLRGPTPGALGAGGGGAQMTFMPGDSKRGVPQFVDVEWGIWPKALNEEMKRDLYSRPDRGSAAWDSDYDEYVKRVKRFRTRVDLSSIVTSEVVSKAQSNAKSGNIKLTVKFNNDQVKIEAQPEQFR